MVGETAEAGKLPHQVHRRYYRITGKTSSVLVLNKDLKENRTFIV